MVMGRLKHVHLPLVLGISLFIPLLLGYSFYVDLSETVLLSSDLSFEDPGDEDLFSYQNEIKIFVPHVSSDPLAIGTHFDALSYPVSSSLTSLTQNSPVLRC
jgi:hypothetical protein